MSNALVTDEWILSYAAGGLDQGHALLVATQAAMRPEVRRKVSEAEAVGGALLETSATMPVSDGLLDKILSRLPEAEPEERPQVKITGLPAPLADYLGCGLEDLDWRFMGPGLKNVRLWTGPRGERLWLLRATGGITIPEHGHRGVEMTLVLRGRYHCGAESFGPGDMDLADDDKIHQPVIDPGEDCICLVLTEAPLRFNSLIARIAQPLIGL
ncbi:ChrR family anti-sigma-E factor [Emcibacter nanhaiensis]|uniref:Transcriptional regulator n=1 Tax=Emcibacter nanhaiensis TaxID=1505037 RepID=A0A501PN00_9PROT|nr:ChrR family anti-sigma-E factor [Emcibacter nanhaiensis]TPD61457.1 transcriptional regulator [Emcibacter nanhaiensis]